MRYLHFLDKERNTSVLYFSRKFKVFLCDYGFEVRVKFMQVGVIGILSKIVKIQL